MRSFGKPFSRTLSLLTPLLLLPLAALAAPPITSTLPRDVPAHHWAAGSVQRLEHQKILGRDPDGRFRGDKPVTRYELAVALDRFVRYLEAARKPLHAEVLNPTMTVPAQASPTVRHALEHLVTNGFLPPNSPLLTQNGSKPATAKELTEALASVTIHLSDRAEATRQ